MRVAPRRFWRKALLVVGAALVFLGFNSHAEESGQSWHGGSVQLESDISALRTTRLNRGNFLKMADQSGRAAFLVEGVSDGFSYRVRADEIVERNDGVNSHSDFTLQELNKSFQLSESTSLSVGKRIYSLDQSYIGQPLGFFQKQTDLTDPTDSRGLSEGIPMIALSWVGTSAFATAIYSNDIGVREDGYNRGLKQWVLRFGYQFKDADIAVLLRRVDGESTGIGGTGSWAISDDLNIYGSFYTARGTKQPVPWAVLGGPFRFVGTTDEAIGSGRANNDIWYPRIAIGSVFTPRNLPKVQVELIYDRRGLSDPEYQRYIKMIQFHESGYQRGFPEGLVGANLGFDAQVLTSKGIRRKYLSISSDYAIESVSFNGGVYIGLEDWSSVYYLSAIKSLSKNTSILFSGTLFRGPENSERRLLPIDHMFSVVFKWQF